MNTPLDVQPDDTATASRLGVGSRLLAAAAVAVVMVVGILVLGRVASDDLMAMGLTTVFFVLLGAGLARLVWRRRELLVPLGVAYVVVAGAAGLLLGLPLITDDVVEEDVIRVDGPGMPSGGGAAGSSASQSADASSSDEPPGEPSGPVQVARGSFEARVHPGEGTATLIDTADGSVLTLTDFATDNGPDLLVYLVPPQAPEGTVEGFVDLGTLRGNIGDQQYEVPADVDVGAGWRVVVWCRAFAVNFTEATLR